MKKLFLLLLTVLLLISYSYSHENKKKQKATIEPTVLLTAAQLEKYGFVSLDGEEFLLLFLDEGFILSNYKDKLLIRYKSPDDVRQYKEYGKGPGQFLAPGDMFKYDDQTIGMFDLIKKSVLLFDLDLNYLGEIKVDPKTARISSLGDSNRFIAFGYFKGKIFAFLDRDFKIMETFVPEVTKGPFPGLTPTHLNFGYFLNNSQFAYSLTYFTGKECSADIYDADTKEISLTLKWEQDHLPTKEDKKQLKNRYYRGTIHSHNGYYLVLNAFMRDMYAMPKYDLIIFDQKGKIRFRDKDFPYSPIINIYSTPKSRIYFITEDENLAYLDFNDLLAQSKN